MRYFGIAVLQERLEAAEAYDEQREGRGDRFDAAVDATLRRIQQLPRAHRRIPNVVRPFMRSARVKGFPYHVVYFIDRGDPVIVAIAHDKRAPEYWRNRLR